MNKKELYSIIKKRIEELQVDSTIDPGYEMCKEYVSNNKVIKTEDFLNIDIFSFIKCKIYIDLDGISIEESEELTNLIKIGFAPLDADDILNVFNYFNIFKEDNEIDNILDYLKEDSIIKENIPYRKVYQHDKELKEVVRNLKYTNYKEIEEIISFLEILRDNDSDKIGNIIELFYVYKVMLEYQKELDERIEENVSFNVRKRDKKKLLNDIYKDSFKVRNVLNEAKSIQKYVISYETIKRNEEKEKQRELTGLNKAISLLEKELEKDEITNVDSIIRLVKSSEIKLAFLEFIYEYNKKYYSLLDKELESLNKNTKVSYQALLNDYNISIDSNMIKDIMHNSIEDLKEMIIILTKFNLSKDIIVDIITNSSKESVFNIKEYIDKGYLTKSIIERNIDLFYIKSEKLEVYNNNIDILKKYNINPAIFKASINILLYRNELLANNLELLQTYDLLKSLKTTDDYSFLLDKELVLKIDKLIELGYEYFLEEDLNILNSNNIKRLEVLRVMNYDLES